MTIKEILSEVYPVSSQAASQLEAVAVPRKFAKKERLVNQGQHCKNFFFISKGLCRGLHEEDGKEDTRWFASQGDVITSVSAWHTGSPAIFSIEAITDVSCFAVSYRHMRDILETNREIQSWALKILMEQLYVLELRYVIIGTGDARSRYEALLQGRPQEMLNLIPLKYIAQYLKISQETLSRVRKAYAMS